MAITMEKNAGILNTQNPITPGSSLVPLQAEGSRPITYLVHGMAGHLLRFKTLARYMAPDYPLYGLQAKGLYDDRTLSQSVEEMAIDYISEVQAQQPEGPYCLGGFSFGGYVAFEMARQLHSRGQQVALLAILDTPASVIPLYDESLKPAQLLSYKARSLAKRAKLKVQQNSIILSQVRSKFKGNQKTQRNQSGAHLVTKGTQMPSANLGKVMQLEGEAGMGEGELASPYQYMIDANMSAMTKYLFQTYPGKITLFKAERAWKGVIFGWEALAGDGVEIHRIPGNHLKILEEPNVQVLADKLKACIFRSIEA